MNKLVPVLVLVLGLVAGGAAGYFIAKHSGPPIETGSTAGEAGEKPLFYRNPMNPAITSPVPAKDEMGMDYIPVYADKPTTDAERKVLFYRNPMNPAITSPVPAKDEMGMDYIPVYADGGAGGTDKPGTVTIDPVTVQNIGVRTTTAKQKTLAREIRAVGRIAYDEEGLSRLHPKTNGWIEELFIDETGVLVDKDTILLSIYSPKLVSTQQEFLLALNNQDVLSKSPFEDVRQGADSLVKSSLERLKLLDVPQHQIDDLERTRQIQKSLHVHSPFRGIVMNIGVREGQYVTPQTELYMIADLSRVWVLADIYEDDLPWVQVGDSATVDVVGLPGHRYEGKVAYIYPYLETKSRTIRVRLEFENPEFRLKPDMYANVRIAASRQIDAIVVPSEAIVRSGPRAIVFVDLGEGKFEPREVTLGVTADGLTQVISGISSGDPVVTSSQFLIDSESKLREATAKMLEAMSGAEHGGQGAEGGMSHDDMSHDASLQKDMSHEGMSHDDMSHDASSHESMSHDDMSHSAQSHDETSHGDEPQQAEPDDMGKKTGTDSTHEGHAHPQGDGGAEEPHGNHESREAGK